jgi:hypothetical protein
LRTLSPLVAPIHVLLMLLRHVHKGHPTILRRGRNFGIQRLAVALPDRRKAIRIDILVLNQISTNGIRPPFG